LQPERSLFVTSKEGRDQYNQEGILKESTRNYSREIMCRRRGFLIVFPKGSAMKIQDRLSFDRAERHFMLAQKMETTFELLGILPG